MTMDEKELKAIQHYIQTILNCNSYIVSVNHKTYIDTADLREDLRYITKCLKGLKHDK